MNAIFCEYMRKTVEFYVDDIAVKSRAKGDHIADLKTIFDIMWRHQLKMNPAKSFLGVASGKFLRFVVTSKRIHLDPEKVRAIQEMQPPRNLRELKGLQRRLAYIQRFISNLSGQCQPFTKLMKKGCLIHLGRRLPTSVRGNQAVPHASSSPCSSGVRKTFPDIRSSHGVIL